MRCPKKHIFIRTIIIPAVLMMLILSACHSGRIDTSKNSVNAKTYRSNDMRDERAAEATAPASESEVKGTGSAEGDAEPDQ